ncbi:MAG: chemotaxis protein CheW [Deltaproteobacteria bacterium]|nr:chemotaxis protein CheW [Deltaproteobacteria bacterium]
MATEAQLCTFFLGPHYFGVDVLGVQEVIRYQEMTPVPLAPVEIRGLINLRGQIVMAIDLRLRLGLPEREPGALPMNVVLTTDEGPVSLLVDAIGDVMQVDESRFAAAPETLEGLSRDLILGVYKLEEQLLLVLDTDGVISQGLVPGDDAGDGAQNSTSTPNSLPLPRPLESRYDDVQESS